MKVLSKSRTAYAADPVTDTAIETSTAGELIDRSGFLSFLSKAGIAVVAATATVLAKPAPSAHANGNCHPQSPGCCCLKFAPGGCPGNGSSHTCPAGYTKRYWSCCAPGARGRYCSECTSGSSCWNPVWVCSESWTVNFIC